MFSKTLLASVLCAAVAIASPTLEKRDSVPGFDVSHHTGTVDYTTAVSNGAKFVYIKATEGLSYVDPKFSTNQAKATSAGLTTGAYHFANPHEDNGAAQAKYFISHGGGWSAGKLPGAVDLEYNDSLGTCYKLSTAEIVKWIKDFSDEYKSSTGVAPVIYTSASWWNSCTDSSTDFGTSNALWVAHYNSKTVGTLPAGWSKHAIWQTAKSGTLPGDQDTFNGATSALKSFAQSGSFS